ncbi:MAG: hypothetical protein AAFW87_04095 [Pseudomonadota bacterium]
MKTPVILGAFVVTLASTFAANAACNYGHGKQTSSCLDGYVWDAETQACVAQPAT